MHRRRLTRPGNRSTRRRVAAKPHHKPAQALTKPRASGQPDKSDNRTTTLQRQRCAQCQRGTVQRGRQRGTQRSWPALIVAPASAFAVMISWTTSASVGGRLGCRRDRPQSLAWLAPRSCACPGNRPWPDRGWLPAHRPTPARLASSAAIVRPMTTRAATTARPRLVSRIGVGDTPATPSQHCPCHYDGTLRPRARPAGESN